LRSGDKVSIREKSKSLVVIAASLGSTNMKYDWLSWDNNTMTGTFISAPHREQIPENIKEQLIVELYNK